MRGQERRELEEEWGHKPNQAKQVTGPPSADDEAKLQGGRTMKSPAGAAAVNQHSELGKSSKRQPFDFISC